MDFTFGGKYRLEEELAIGGCGTVFYGVHTIAGKEVAIKLEPAIAKHSPLKHESKIYKSLMGGPGVPWMIWSGRQGDYNVMVIDLLGPSLEDLFKMCNRHFSLKTVLLLADQLISRVEFIHTRDLVHRDIKPANFVMGTGQSAHLVNVIDFGLAKKFRDPRTGTHIPYRQDAHHGVGTSLFASINTHLGIECSPRDDLESLSYMLIYFLRGTLPWRKLKSTTVSGTWDLIRDSKIAAEATLTHNLPREFALLHEYARGLDFGDIPDYAGMRTLMRDLGKRVGVLYPEIDDGISSTGSGSSGGMAPEGWCEFDWMVGRGGERRGRNCEACRKRREASWGGHE
ncbi:kinase-like protein [Artomyces pyxidatus]|uniref:Kinase-like protein n=1 Tax=Artomyces pyxidatus TaxID=48021 RepID=A0ACB8TGK1_9AGAM|nr:kinase-like protein [Artomyces pyxidatus]